MDRLFPGTLCAGRFARLAFVALAWLASVNSLQAAAAPPDEGIRFLEDRTKSDPDDFIAQNQLALRYLNKLRQTGDYAHLAGARRAAEASLAAVPAARNAGGLALLTRVQLAAHRFPDAVSSATQLAELAPEKSSSHAILGDALLELGDDAGAKSAFEKMQRIDPRSVDTLSRLARRSLLSGNAAAARDHLTAALSAARELFPESPETLAWCEVQLGELAFGRGDWEEAEKNYRAALKDFPDYYAAIDHLAEVRAARGDYPGALALYEPLTQRVPRPEFLQAVGDVLAFSGKPEEARPWHDRALAGYKQSVEQGEVAFLHHLASFFADVRENPTEAVKCARKDLELRHSAAAHETLAWALFRGGDFPAAAAEMERALASGQRSAHLLYHAGMVFSAAGDLDRGKKFLGEALEVNPRYHAFHVHR